MAVIDLSKYTVTLNKTLMAENKISVTIGLPTAFVFSILDTYVLDGETYKLNRPPKETKGGKDAFTYNLVLEAQQYELNRKIFLLNGNREFTIVGDLEFFVDLVLTNINSINSGWTKGSIVATSDKNLTFTSEDCRSVLGKLADEFDVEFKIDAKVITFADQVGSATGLTFQYGLDNGLYQLSRQNVDSKNTVTRVYGFGSSQNLPNDYRSGFNQLVFEAKYLEDTSEYPDIVEGEVTFKDIKPSFEGAITTVTGANNVTISVTSMDFDLEAQLNAGVTAKVVFNSGDLLGQQFEILDNSYVDLTKTFTLIATEDATGTTYPNATFKPLVGDLITFVDIHMPASYITAAESELEAATQTYLDENKKFRVTYNLTFDNRHTDAQSLDIGDTVVLIDTDFNVNRTIRITSITKKFDDTKLQLFTGKISDYVPVNLEQRLIAKTINSEKTIIVNNSVSKDDSRRNTLKNRKLNDLVFDPDGFFDTDNIRPLSINTLFLSVGAKSQNFKLATSVIEANYLADENRMVVSAGTLYHREVEGDAGFVWTLSAFDQSSLVAGTDYFAYVKCSKTASTGVFFLSTSQLAADPDDGFFYFWLGILYAVTSGRRDFDLTNGMTFINGNTITTGRVQSLNGLNYLDLDLNKFALGDGTNGIDWNVTASNTLTLKGALVQNAGAFTAGLSVFRGAYSGAATYYLDDTVTNDGSTWRYINATPSSGNTPAEDAFWTIEAAKGDTGSGGATGDTGNFVEYQFAKNGSTTVPPSIVTTDVNPAGWSITPPSLGSLEYLWMTTATKNAAGDTLIVDWSTPIRTSGIDGADGLTARAVSITTDVQGFSYDTNGANPTPSTSTITATALNTTGTVFYDFLLNGVSDQNTTSNTYTYTPQSAYSSMPDEIQIDIREGADTGTILSSDVMTMVGLKAGENAITIILSNEAHTLPTTNSGVVTYTGSGTTIEVWEGTTQLTIDQNVAYGNSTFRVTAGVEFVGDFDNVDFDDFDDGLFFVTPITNITVGSQSGADGSNTITYGDASMMNANSAYIPFNITVKNSAGVEFNFNRIQSFAKSVEGADGGGTGDVGASAVFQGVWDNTVDYFGDGVRVDIVQYTGVYYVARTDPPASPFSGIVPTNTAYWNTFGATFESVATDLLFASLAYIENLGVRFLRTDVTGQRIFIDGDNNEMTFFNDAEEEVLKLSNAGMVAKMVDSVFKSTTTGVGNLAGSVAATQANVTGQSEIFSMAITGTSGSADISCNGVTRTISFTSDIETSISLFVTNHAAAFNAVDCLIQDAGNDMIFTSDVGVAFTSDPAIVNVSGNLDGTPSQTQAPIISVKRIDTVTLTGTDGIANVTCDANTEQVIWSGLLTETASNFAFLHAAGYLVGGVVVTSSGDDIIFTADVAGVDFTGSTSIANTPNASFGSIKIDGNQIWENDQNSDSNSLIFINEKGYLGGKTKYRALGIGNGRGELMMLFDGNLGKTTSFANTLFVDGVELILDKIPTSGAGLGAGEVYRDGAGADAALKIK